MNDEKKNKIIDCSTKFVDHFSTRFLYRIIVYNELLIIHKTTQKFHIINASLHIQSIVLERPPVLSETLC